MNTFISQEGYVPSLHENLPAFGVQQSGPKEVLVRFTEGVPVKAQEAVLRTFKETHGGTALEDHVFQDMVCSGRETLAELVVKGDLRYEPVAKRWVWLGE